MALAVREYAAEHRLIADEFLEELIVRRELAFNFVRNARRVDSLDELPDWARATLDAHRDDARDPVYTPQQFEDAATYDNLWNATQQELAAARQDPRLLPHVLGQEDSRMVGDRPKRRSRP